MRYILPLLTISACFLASCERQPGPAETDGRAGNEAASAATVAGDPTAAEKAATAPQAGSVQKRAAAMPREITVKELQGSWKVVSISASSHTKKAVARRLKQPMRGAIVDIYPEQMRWSFMPQKSEGSNDFCEEPVSGIIIQPVARERADAFFAAALKSMKLASAATGNPHEWLCAAGGKWGLSESSGALFLPLARGEMLMGWHDGRILRLKRMGRAAPKNIKPEAVIVDREE